MHKAAYPAGHRNTKLSLAHAQPNSTDLGVCMAGQGANHKESARFSIERLQTASDHDCSLFRAFVYRYVHAQMPQGHITQHGQNGQSMLYECQSTCLCSELFLCISQSLQPELEAALRWVGVRGEHKSSYPQWQTLLLCLMLCHV